MTTEKSAIVVKICSDTGLSFKTVRSVEFCNRGRKFCILVNCSDIESESENKLIYSVVVTHNFRG